MNAVHMKMVFPCEECGKEFTQNDNLATHRLICTGNRKRTLPMEPEPAKKPKVQVGKGKQSLGNSVAVETFTPTNNHDILHAIKNWNHRYANIYMSKWKME